jgi:osmotically-inducible protein OsmY
MDRRSVVMLGVGLWGLLALAAIYWGVDAVERDLTARSRAELAGGGQRWASVRYSGRVATLTGAAPSADARAQAGALVRSLPGVASVRDETTAPPPVVK